MIAKFIFILLMLGCKRVVKGSELIVALSSENFEEAENLIKDYRVGDRRLETTNKRGETALMIAVGKGSLKVVDQLVKLGADPLKRGPRNRIPLMYLWDFYMICQDDSSIYSEIVEVLLHEKREEQLDLVMDLKSNNFILYSISQGCLVLLKAILPHYKSGSDRLNNSDKFGDTGVIISAREGDVEILKLFIESGAEVDGRNSKRGSTALMIAAERGHKDVVDYLLSKGADLLAVDEMDRTALIYAVTLSDESQVDILNILLNSREREQLAAKSKLGNTALMLAISGVNAKITRELLKRYKQDDPLLLTRNIRGERALEMAVETFVKYDEDFFEIVSELVDKNILIDGRMVVKAMLLSSDQEVVLKLLNLSANYSDESWGIALIEAVRSYCDRVVELLIEKGVDPFILNGYGESALTLAAVQNYQEIALKLIEASKDGDVRLNYCSSSLGYTALMLAVKNLNIELVRSLISKGADVDIASEDGYTALMLAVNKGAIDIVRELLNSGADTDLKNSQQETALMIAQKSELKVASEIIKMLGGSDQ